MSADFFHAMCSSRAIGTEFLAHGEKSEVTRHNSTCQLSPVPMRRRIAPLHTADIIPLAEQGFGKYCRVSRKVANISALLRLRARLLPD
jgi:hypothetical protein